MISIPRTSFQPSQSFKSFKSLFRFLFWFPQKKQRFCKTKIATKIDAKTIEKGLVYNEHNV